MELVRLVLYLSLHHAAALLSAVSGVLGGLSGGGNSRRRQRRPTVASPTLNRHVQPGSGDKQAGRPPLVRPKQDTGSIDKIETKSQGSETGYQNVAAGSAHSYTSERGVVGPATVESGSKQEVKPGENGSTSAAPTASASQGQEAASEQKGSERDSDELRHSLGDQASGAGGKRKTLPPAVVRTMEQIARRHMLARQGSIKGGLVGGGGIAGGSAAGGADGPQPRKRSLRERLKNRKLEMQQLQKSLKSTKSGAPLQLPADPDFGSPAMGPGSVAGMQPGLKSDQAARRAADSDGASATSKGKQTVGNFSAASLEGTPSGGATGHGNVGAGTAELGTRSHRRTTDNIVLPGASDDATAFRSGASRDSVRQGFPGLPHTTGTYSSLQPAGGSEEVQRLRQRVAELEAQLKQLEEVRSAVHDTRDRLVRQEKQDQANLQAVRDIVAGWREEARSFVSALPAEEGRQLAQRWEERTVALARREAVAKSQRAAAELKRSIRSLELRQAALQSSTLSGGMRDVANSLLGFFLQGLLMFLAHVGVPMIRPFLACMAWARPGLRKNCPIVLSVLDCECCCPSGSDGDDDDSEAEGDGSSAGLGPEGVMPVEGRWERDDRRSSPRDGRGHRSGHSRYRDHRQSSRFGPSGRRPQSTRWDHPEDGPVDKPDRWQDQRVARGPYRPHTSRHRSGVLDHSGNQTSGSGAGMQHERRQELGRGDAHYGGSEGSPGMYPQRSGGLFGAAGYQGNRRMGWPHRDSHANSGSSTPSEWGMPTPKDGQQHTHGYPSADVAGRPAWEDGSPQRDSRYGELAPDVPEGREADGRIAAGMVRSLQQFASSRGFNSAMPGGGQGRLGSRADSGRLDSAGDSASDSERDARDGPHPTRPDGQTDSRLAAVESSSPGRPPLAPARRGEEVGPWSRRDAHAADGWRRPEGGGDNVFAYDSPAMAGLAGSAHPLGAGSAGRRSNLDSAQGSGMGGAVHDGEHLPPSSSGGGGGVSSSRHSSFDFEDDAIRAMAGDRYRTEPRDYQRYAPGGPIAAGRPMPGSGRGTGSARHAGGFPRPREAVDQRGGGWQNSRSLYRRPAQYPTAARPGRDVTERGGGQRRAHPRLDRNPEQRIGSVDGTAGEFEASRAASLDNGPNSMGVRRRR